MRKNSYNEEKKNRVKGREKKSIIKNRLIKTQKEQNELQKNRK